MFRALTAVWCTVLIVKLSSKGIHDPFLDWLINFLHTHKQCIALNGILYHALSIEVGVCHGSVFISLFGQVHFAGDLTFCQKVSHANDR